MTKTNLKILISNDDGVNNIGIDLLGRYAMKWGNVTIIAPETQQSAKGKSLTFDKPIRINKAKTQSGLDAYAYNASPADSIMINEHINGTPDIVLSGINAGDNTSIHSILTSGTCAVAMEAGLKDIPAFAFSIIVPSNYYFGTEIPGDIEKAAEISINIAKSFINQVKSDFWEKVMFININFPEKIVESTEIVVADLETYKYDNYLVERTDPKDEKYYWLWGKLRNEFDESKDSSRLFKDNCITITPVSMIETAYLMNETRRVVNHLSI